MDTLNNVKTLLGIEEDDLQDRPLTIIISNVRAHLTLWLKKHTDLKEIPEELNFIVEELAIARFQRIGSEAMKSESVEGHSVTYNEDDFAPYLSILSAYIPYDEEKKRGKVCFY
ncbi:phage head-tail connector protein [Virgibacillus pantothenticus]|uniref:phage head-tail connector protein n=1 Tax=Virgibacillus pantothenticus TaxID=1473 RepID=UPI001481AAAA|nr:phage head-tail connector protein [Virgibacillus pantothenticus]MBU8567583.1 phage head-tail connector protein [Virgibacillus pantothenticus]MBU8601371.1 phage head-tail connector protein [Virgibacillus pantothenticus]MBU8636188.1 phage head-tail connector protein [Virgibacillus pantothenticus]MBU8643708.1 phage head-tail connector protein [Virgibacillus pantothenticus]MBU8648036.1 phage head-tail connector protein [Virgibacillus pantothenticus]